MKRLDKLVPYSPEKYKKMRRELEEAAHPELPLQEKTAPPAFKRLRRRGSQKWLGE